jgi:hypothetical protein
MKIQGFATHTFTTSSSNPDIKVGVSHLFIYLVRVELESVRLSKHVSMCTCAHYEALVTITFFYEARFTVVPE